MDFKRLSLLARLKMSEEELSHYYRELRYYKHLKNEPIKGIKWRRATNIVAQLLLKIDRLITGRKYVLCKDNRIDTKRPHIYACSHVGRYDIETAMEAIGHQVFFVMGDAGETYRNFEGLFLDFQGRIAFDTGYQVSDELRSIKDLPIEESSKIIDAYLDFMDYDEEIVELYLKYGSNKFIVEAMKKSMNYEPVDTDKLRLVIEYYYDRHIGQQTITEYAKAGADILIYPEGAWNLSPNLLTQKLFSGAVRVARDSGADIIPIGVVKYGKKYMVSFGKNMLPEDFKSNKEMREALRDNLSTLKWEIMESQGQTKRIELSSNALQEYVDEIMSETSNGYTIDVINASKFIDPIPSYDEVFEPIKKLTKKN